MCECRTTIEKRLLEQFVEQNPEATEHKASLTGYAFIISKKLGMTMKGQMPFELTALFPLKKGGTKEKKIKQSMIFNYCPFCGEKYQEEA